MSTCPEYDETATTVERIARRLGDDQSLAREALHMAAQLLRRDERLSHERLTRLLHLIEIGELLSAASIRLEIQAATGNMDARRAAGYIAAAGALRYPDGERP